MSQILNSINANFKKPRFESNLNTFKFNKQINEEELYTRRRIALDSLTQSAMPSSLLLNDYSNSLYTKEVKRNIQTLESVSFLLSPQSQGGKVVTYDMETVGGVSAIDYYNQMTPREKRMLSVTELALQRNYINPGGAIANDVDRQVYSWGISKTQQPDYLNFFKDLRQMSWEEINQHPSYRSTVERLARYSGPFEEMFQPVKYANGQSIYQLRGGLQASTFNLEKAYEGYLNLTQVGRHQGFDTKLGQSLYQEVKETFHQAQVIAGYNNHQFDDRIFSELEGLFPNLSPLEFPHEKSYDGLAIRRLADQGNDTLTLKQIATNAGVELTDYNHPTKLETTAKAAGIRIDAHEASSDVNATFELLFNQSVYGTQQENFPTYALNQIAMNPSFNETSSISSNSHVLMVNKSLKATPQSSDYLKVNGEIVTTHDWFLPRGEAFSIDHYRFIPKEELLETTSEEVATSILNGANATDGVYSLKLKGASKHNKDSEVHLIRGTQEEVQSLFENHLVSYELISSNQAPTSIHQITQKTVDKITKTAEEDRARRDLMSYLYGNGSYGYQDTKKVYELYEDLKEQLETKGLSANKETFKKLFKDQIEGIDAQATFKAHGVSYSSSRQKSFEHLSGVFKSSHETMTNAFKKIDESFTLEYLKRIAGHLSEQQLEDQANFLKQQALSGVFEQLEFQTKGTNQTTRDVYSLKLPRFDDLGNATDEWREVNFATAKNGQANLMSLLREAGKEQAETIQHSTRSKVLNQVVEQLVNQDLLPSSYLELTQNPTNLYSMTGSISHHIHQKMEEAIQLMPDGVESLIQSNDGLNAQIDQVIGALDENLSESDRRFYTSFLNQQKEQELSRFKLSSLQARPKESDVQFMGLDSLQKKRPSYVAGLIDDSIQSTKDTYRHFSGLNHQDFEYTANLLRERHYTDKEIQEVRKLLFGQIETENGLFKSKKLKGLVSDHQMNVTFFEQKGQLYLGAVQKQDSKKFLQAISSNQSINELKKQGLVLQLPNVTDELGFRTIKQGTTHKVVNHRLNTYVQEGVLNQSELARPSSYLRTQLRSTVEESLAGYHIVQNRMMEAYHNKDLETANKIVNGELLKPISNASGLTSRQTLFDASTGQLRTGYIPNLNDLSTVHDIDAASLYAYLPMVYEKDDVVRKRINHILAEDTGDAQAAQKVMARLNEKIQKRQAPTLEGGSDLILEQYFLENLMQGDHLFSRISQSVRQNGDTRTANLFDEILATNPSQILGEKRAQWGKINTQSPIEEVALGFFSNTIRPNINAGRNTLAIDMNRFAEGEKERLETLGVQFGDRLMTQQAFQKTESFRRLNPGFQPYEHSYTAKFKAISTHEGYQAINDLSEDVLQSFDGKYSIEDFKLVQSRLLENMNTHEQRIVMHPALYSGSWADAEQTSFRAKGVSEEALDELVSEQRLIKKGDVIGQRTVNGVVEDVVYNRQTEGRIVSREGQMLFIQPTERSTEGIKLAIGNLEKGMGFAPHLATDEKHLTPLMDAMWKEAFGQDVVALANPEMLKHGAASTMFGRYFLSSSQEVMGTNSENLYLSIMNRNMPGLDLAFQTNGQGQRILTHQGNPNGTGGYLEGLQQSLKEFQVIAADPSSPYQKDFKRVMDRIQKEVQNEEYITTISRTTMTEQIPSNRVKGQLRGRQILGTQDAKTREAAKLLNQWEIGVSQTTPAYEEAKRYVDSLGTTILSAKGEADLYELTDQIVKKSFEELDLPQSGITAEQMQKTFFGVVGKRNNLDAYQTIQVDLGDISVLNPFTEEMTNQVYIPRAILHATDGEVYLSGVNKKTADFLKTIDDIKRGKSSDTLETALEKASTAYKEMFASFYPELTGKDGVVRDRLLQGKIEYSTRGLGANIEAPITKQMMEAYQSGESLHEATQQLIEDLMNKKTDGLEFYREEAYKYAIQQMDDGSIRLLDTVKVSRQQLKASGVDFKAIGEQVIDKSFWKNANEYDTFMKEVTAMKSYQQIGEHYARTQGIMGVYGRDPYFHNGSRRVAKAYLDDEVKGRSFSIFAWMAKALEQDTDGDNTNMTFFLRKNGKTTELYEQTSDLMEAANTVREAQAVENTEKYMIDALKGYDLSSSSTGRTQTIGQDILDYQAQLKENQTGILNHQLQDNLYKNEHLLQTSIRGRHGKLAIGHLSNPNYMIREASNALLLPVDKKASDAIGHLTRVTEQKMISVKGIKGVIKRQSGVMMYSRGVRQLMKADGFDEQVKATTQIVNSFKGSVTSDDFTVPIEELLKGTLDFSAFSQDEQKLLEGVQELHKLSRRQEARAIYNSSSMTNRFLSADQVIDFFKGKHQSYGSEHLEAVQAYLPGNQQTILQIGKQKVGLAGENVLTHDGSVYPMGVYRPLEIKDEKGQKRLILKNELKEGQTIQIPFSKEEELTGRLSNEFKIKKQSETSALADEFIEQFTQAPKDYASFVDQEILSRTLEGSLYKNGSFDIIEVENRLKEQIQSTYYQNHPEASSQAFDRLKMRLNQYDTDELSLMGQASAYFDSELGKDVKDFSLLTEHLIQQDQLSREKGKAMIAQFNENIRQRAYSKDRAQTEALAAFLPASHFQPASIQRLTEEARVNVKPMTSTYSARQIQEQVETSFPVHNRADFNQALEYHLNQLTQELDPSLLERQGAKEAVAEKVVDPLLQEIEQSRQAFIQRRVQQFEDIFKERGREAFGYLEDDVLNRTLSTQASSLIKPLEKASVMGGELSGRLIGDLSVPQLQEYLTGLEGAGELSELQQISKRHVSAYLDAIAQGPSQVQETVRARPNVEIGSGFDAEKIQGITTKDLNEAILNRAKHEAKDYSHLSSAVDDVASSWVSKLKNPANRMGIGLSIGAIAMMTGMQYTANQNMIQATRQAKEDVQPEVPTTAKIQPIAPASGYNGTTSYLKEESHYNIQARANRRTDMRTIENSISRMTGSSSMRVTNTDDREEISDRWLQERLLSAL